MTNQIKKNYQPTNFANRGMGLEDDLEKTNIYYYENNIAVIHKKPTAVTIKKVTYPNKKYTKIIDGYFTKPSTTDYNGIYKKRYIDFEAKETKKESLTINAIHPHQIEHLKKIDYHGGIAFLIIRFTHKGETYLLSYKSFNKFIEIENRKSIPYQYIKDNGFIIPLSYQPRIDYIKIINKHFLEEEEK